MNRLFIFFLMILLAIGSLHAKEFATKSQIKKLQKEYGGRSGERLTNWNNLMKSLVGKSHITQARKIDAYFNQYQYKYDSTIKNVRYAVDTWRTFRNFLGQLGGDCEDYALAKYYSLRRLGVPKEKLKFFSGYIGTQYKGGRHMVLAYVPKKNSDPLILDNNTIYAEYLSKRTNLKPFVYFNELEYGVMSDDERATEDLAIHRYHTFKHWLMRNNKDKL